MKYLIAVSLLVSALCLSNCKKDKDAPGLKDGGSSFNRKEMLMNIGNNIIIPYYKEFKKTADSLRRKSLVFKSEPTEDNLEAVQNAWKDAATAWKKCELFKLGPGALVGLGYYSSIDYKTINPTIIESNISSGSTIDSTYIESLGATVKGLPSLEYLLFSKDNGNSFILDKYSGTSDLAIQRRNYLGALCENLYYKASSLLNDWVSDGGNYISTFTSAVGNGVYGSVGLLVNNMVYMSDLIKNVKVGQPLGKDNEGVPQPNTVEAGESEMSLSHIRSNIQTMQNVFNGIGVLEDLKGFDDMLNSMEVKSGNVLLSDRINAQFNAINQTLDEIQVPLQEAVVTSPAKVDELYTEMKDLLLLIKVDMVSNLGVVLTISDNDGD